MSNEAVAQPKQELEVMPKPSDAYVARAEARSLEFMNPKRWQAMEHMAKTFIQSGALPSSIQNAPQLIMVFQSGYEAGLQPIEALNSFYFVNGKMSMYGDTVIAQVLKAGHKVEWGECDDKTATVTITRKDNGISDTKTFTMEQAKARGLTQGHKGPKDVWSKFPENMLRYKVFAMVAHFVVPDALKGIQVGDSPEIVATARAIEEEKRERVEDERILSEQLKNAVRGAMNTPVKTKGQKTLLDTLNEKPKKKTAKKVEVDSKPKTKKNAKK